MFRIAVLGGRYQVHPMQTRHVSTPFGDLSISADDHAVRRVRWGKEDDATPHPLLDQAAQEIAEYVDGARQHFDVPIRVDGSGFQRDVCAAMQAIPFGETRTYGDIAKDLGVTPQAVGQACGANPIPILIPCHRVMGANGKLVGFSGGTGVETKVALLKHEGAGGFLI